MRTRLLLMMVLLCACIPSFGQMVGDVREFIEFKERPLLVVLPEPFNEEDQSEVDRINQILKSRVESLWTLNRGVTYMTASEMKRLREKKRKEIMTHAVLAFTVWKASSSHTQHNGATNFHSWYSSTLTVGLLEDAVKDRYSYIHNFTPVYPSEGELVSALLQVQSYMSKSIRNKEAVSFPKESKINADRLKKVTLLVDRNLLMERLTEQEIQDSYGLPFKLVDTEEIESTILNRTKGYAYVCILPTAIRSPHMTAQLVIDAENGEVLAHSFPPRLRVGTSAANGDKIRKGSFKDYVRYIVR